MSGYAALTRPTPTCLTTGTPRPPRPYSPVRPYPEHREGWIEGDQGNPFDFALGGQHAVEGIPVVDIEGARPQGMKLVVVAVGQRVPDWAQTAMKSHIVVCKPPMALRNSGDTGSPANRLLPLASTRLT